ncbi:MAG: hypothetical protein EP329_05885, partial [Deltaproteobacteria bacterium]
MKIRCEKCSVEHELDPPAWVVETGRPFRFRCSSCGHSHLVDLQDAGASEPESAPAAKPSTEPEPEPNDDVYLKQEGKVYLVKTWDNLERWIEEGRVGPEDLVSEGGVRWSPVSSRPELARLFEEEEVEPEVPAGVPFAATPFTPSTPFGSETPFSSQEMPFDANSPMSSFDPSEMPFPTDGATEAPTDVMSAAEADAIYPPALLDEGTPAPPPPLTPPQPMMPAPSTPAPAEPSPAPLKLSEVPTLTRERFSQLEEMPTGDEEVEGLTAERIPPALNNSLPDDQANAFFDGYQDPPTSDDDLDWQPRREPPLLLIGVGVVVIVALLAVGGLYASGAFDPPPEAPPPGPSLAGSLGDREQPTPAPVEPAPAEPAPAEVAPA